MPDFTRSRREFLAGMALVGAGASAGCLNAPAEDSTNPVSSTPSTTPATTPPPADDARFADVYQQTIDSVAMVNGYGPQGPVGQGSGFVYEGEYIITNEHVITEADFVELQFRGNRWAEGTIIGSDIYSDLAVIEAPGLPPSANPLQSAETHATIGQEVLALGNPFGFEESVSQGIVSGRNRSLPTGTGFRIPATIQTDASVNPGNSGGPLVALDGQYLGVITARAGSDIGFAISWQLAERVLPALITQGEYDHPYLGIRSQAVTPGVAEANNLGQTRGVIVIEVLAGDPAAGLLEGSTGSTTINGVNVPIGGDVIVELDGQPIHSNEELSTYLALRKSPGETLEVGVIRRGHEVTETIELGERPEP